MEKLLFVKDANRVKIFNNHNFSVLKILKLLRFESPELKIFIYLFYFSIKRDFNSLNDKNH